MSILSIINKKPKLKRLIHWLLIPNGKSRPRVWVKLFLNPFLHKKGYNSRISWRSRMDVLPFNKFVIGSNSTIEDFCTINNGVGNVLIGDHSLIGIGNTIIGPINIGNNVIFAQNIVASGLNHAYQNPDLPIHSQPIIKKQIIIEDDCWIGANSVITAGIKIGKHSVIAAGSIITKDIPAFSVVAGNPAKLIKQFNPETGLWEKKN